MGRRSSFPDMRQKQERRGAAGFAGKDEAACGSEIRRPDFGNYGGDGPGANAFLGGHQRLYGRSGLDKEQARRIKAESGCTPTGDPSKVDRQGAFAYPQPDPGTGGFQGRKRKARRRAGIAIPGLGDFMHAFGRQPEGEGGRRSLIAQPACRLHEA